MFFSGTSAQKSPLLHTVIVAEETAVNERKDYIIMQNECSHEMLCALPLGKAYIPVQEYTAPVSPEEGLKMGTVWTALYQPYDKEDRAR